MVRKPMVLRPILVGICFRKEDRQTIKFNGLLEEVVVQC